MSLKLRLTAFATVLILITLTLISVASYHYVANSFTEQLDASLEDHAAETLDAVTRAGPRFFTDHALPAVAGVRPQTVPFFVQIIGPTGAIWYASPPGGAQVMPVDAGSVRRAVAGAVLTVADESSAPGLRIRYAPLVGPDGRAVAALEVGTLLAPSEGALSLMRLILVSSTILTAALVGLGVWIAAGRTLAAVDRVTRTARIIELSQRLDERIPEAPTGGGDEMGRLVRTFNNMLDRISGSFEAQRQFVADSSHELRSPLTVIRGNLDLLRRTADPAERLRIERLIEDEAARMSRLVDNLLFIAQIEEMERQGSRLDRRPVELDSLLLTVYQQARSMTDRHAILLGDEDAITIDGDRDQLQQLLLNLVDNAIKYTPAGGAIVLSLRAEGDDALLEVRDSGPGIPAADLPHIFDRFYRVDKARSRRIGGAGLGLSIVRGIAVSHGGGVEVESAPGAGTTFRVRLPRGAVQPGAGSVPLLTTSSTESNVVSAGRGPH
jgi:two-component system, OmpR family, sensor kinase